MLLLLLLLLFTTESVTTVSVSAPLEGLEPCPIVACQYRLIICTAVKSTCFGLGYSAGFAIMSKRRPHSIFERWRLNLVRLICMMVFAPPTHALPRSCREGRTPWLYTYLTFFPRILARETRPRTTWAWLAQGQGRGWGGGGGGVTMHSEVSAVHLRLANRA